MAMRFGPVPIGVPMPPKSAANATPSSSALRNGGVSSAGSANSGRRAIIIAPAAMFDIHIDSTAVPAMTASSSTAAARRGRTIQPAMYASIPYRARHRQREAAEEQGHNPRLAARRQHAVQ